MESQKKRVLFTEIKGVNINKNTVGKKLKLMGANRIYCVSMVQLNILNLSYD